MVKWVHLRGKDSYLTCLKLAFVQSFYKRNWLRIIIQKQSTTSPAFGGKIRIWSFLRQHWFLPEVQNTFQNTKSFLLYRNQSIQIAIDMVADNFIFNAHWKETKNWYAVIDTIWQKFVDQSVLKSSLEASVAGQFTVGTHPCNILFVGAISLRFPVIANIIKMRVFATTTF